jgi:hypothetical protein
MADQSVRAPHSEENQHEYDEKNSDADEPAVDEGIEESIE